MAKIKEDWAKFIISEALMEIKTLEDISKVINKVEGTALGVRDDLMKVFLELVKLKKKVFRLEAKK